MIRAIGSLFSGIGGLELGLEWAGFGDTIWQVERDPFCRAILARHWPSAKRWTDVRTVTGLHLAPVDLICGGFPCQDISNAGKREGINGKRSGLWAQFARIIGEVRPFCVVVENVSALRLRGLDVVLSDLETLNYDPLDVIELAASDVGAPHRRKRLFILARTREVVADSGNDRREGGAANDGVRPALEESRRNDAYGCNSNVANAPRSGFERPNKRREKQPIAAGCDPADVADPNGIAVWKQPERQQFKPAIGRDSEPGHDRPIGRGRAESGLGRDANGLPLGMDGRSGRTLWPAAPGQSQHAWEPSRAEPRVIANRAERLHALGNAVVPAVAERVGRRFRELLGLWTPSSPPGILQE